MGGAGPPSCVCVCFGGERAVGGVGVVKRACRNLSLPPPPPPTHFHRFRLSPCRTECDMLPVLGGGRKLRRVIIGKLSSQGSLTSFVWVDAGNGVRAHRSPGGHDDCKGALSTVASPQPGSSEPLLSPCCSSPASTAPGRYILCSKCQPLSHAEFWRVKHSGGFCHSAVGCLYNQGQGGRSC